MGYRWKIGNGKKIRLWKDNWLGSSSLAIQFWPLYRIVNEKGKTVADLWDGVNLKCTFRRNISNELYHSRLDIVELVATIQFSDDEDEMLWQFNSSRIYSSQSLYLPQLKRLKDGHYFWCDICYVRLPLHLDFFFIFSPNLKHILNLTRI
jgi:hypothetical protein